MRLTIVLSIMLLFSCSKEKAPTNPYVMILGITQDAGYPQMNCKKKCCKMAWDNPEIQKMTSCLAIIDPTTKEQWIIDATPNIKDQIQLLKDQTGREKIDGVLLTHAHMGHYTGLLHFGREAMGTYQIPVFAMPRMKSFLEKNGPWSQLIKLENICLKKINDNSPFELNNNIKIKAFLVNHRDEFSETVGYEIIINKKILIFIPDIDKWEKWDTDIIELIQKVDFAFLDGTFYKNGELDRDMSQIPHPFVEESMKLFSKLKYNEKQRIHFIHLNHTNPLLIKNSLAQEEVLKKGFKLASEGQIIQF